MEKRYYIYEIPGVKIGCTWNVKRRVEKNQGYTNYIILETHTDIYEASRREIELQKKHGYRVDTKPYWKTIKMPTTEGSRKAGKKAGKKNKESGHMSNIGKKYGKTNGKINGKIQGKKNVESGHMARIGKIQGKKNVESGHMTALGKLSRKLTFEQAEQIREKFYKMDGGKMERYDTLASEYNVSQSIIWSIIKNKTYTEK
jgi:hypothetical protein